MASDNTVNVEITASVDGLKSGLAQAEKGVKGFGSQADNLTAKTNKMAGAVKVNAVPAITSFSQVIQDAPYGIRGVANNITQLTSQFGYLSTNAGGAKNALKAMIGSLAGPAGILFAISAVTSLMVSYDKEIKNFIFGTDDAKVSIDKLNDALREQLELRKLLKGELSVATNIAVAEAKLAGKSAEEQYSVRKKYAEANLLILQKQYEEAIKTSKDFYQKTKREQGKGDEDLINQQKEYSKDVKDTLKSLNDAKAQLYLDDLNEQIRVQESQKEKVKVFYGQQVKAIQTFKNEIQPIANEMQQSLVNVIPKADVMSDRVAGWLLALQYFNKEANSLIQGSIANTFADLGNSIGEAMAQGTNVFAAAGEAILMGIGGFLSDLGKLMIQYGVAALAYSTASKALLNPLTAAPAAGALIAAGAVLSVIGGAIKSSLGSSGESSSYSSGANSTNYGSSISYGSSSGSGGTYVFEISGTKLIGVLKNTLDRNRNLGGNNNLIFST